MTRPMQHGAWIRRAMAIGLCGGLGLGLLPAQPAAPVGDLWLTGDVLYPAPCQPAQVRSNLFAGLHASATLEQLRVAWPTVAGDVTGASLHVSIDPPGHWPARDWRAQPLTRRADAWEAELPVFDLDLPMVYFVTAVAGGHPVVSPMRIVHPRERGLRQPNRLFWSFLEGFEEGLESWRVLAPEDAILRTDTGARLGRAALAVQLPAGGHSVTVGTTRLRAWHLWKFNHSGLRLWLRTRDGIGRARFSLMSNAGTTNQVVSVFPREVRLTNEWQRVDLPFAEYPRLPRNAVDLLAIEFIGESPREFLVDDLQLLGADRVDR